MYGNRLSQNVTAGSGPSNSVAVSPSTNHITTSGYAYDAVGNMSGDGANTVTYDDESKITAVSGTYGSGSYQYHGSRMRVEKTLSGATTVYIFSGSKVIAEYASGASPSSPQKEYVYAGSASPIAEIDSGSTVKYYEADTLSVRQVTNSSGGVLGNLGQYPYGENWYQSSGQTEFQFTNYLHDSESDNDYAYAREYVNRLARFESLDPASGSVSDPLSWDRYTYVLDDPINGSDPTGRDCVYLNAAGTGIRQGGIDSGGSQLWCEDNGGYWVTGTVTGASIDAEANTVSLTGTTNGTDTTSASYAIDASQEATPLLMAVARGTQMAAPGVNLAYRGLTAFGYVVAAPAMVAAQCLAGSSACTKGNVVLSLVPDLGELGDLGPLTRGARKILGGLLPLADETVADAVRARGGGGAQVSYVASWLQRKTVAQAAELAAQGNAEARTAIKIIKDAARLARK